MRTAFIWPPSKFPPIPCSPLFMACAIAYEASRLIAKKPIYEALAEIFLNDMRAGAKESQKG